MRYIDLIHTRVARIALLIVSAAALSSVAHAQYSSSTNGVPQQSQQPTMPGVLNRPTDSSSTNPTDPGGILDETHRNKLVNDERHKKLLDDTEKLLKLAQDLRTEVEKSGKDELNVDVVKKAAEMEKLSHDIKDRMRY